MEAKKFYSKKLETLKAMAALTKSLQAKLADLSELEGQMPGGDFSEFYTLGTLLADIEGELGYLVDGVEPLATETH